MNWTEFIWIVFILGAFKSESTDDAWAALAFVALIVALTRTLAGV